MKKLRHPTPPNRVLRDDAWAAPFTFIVGLGALALVGFVFLAGLTQAHAVDSSNFLPKFIAGIIVAIVITYCSRYYYDYKSQGWALRAFGATFTLCMGFAFGYTLLGLILKLAHLGG